MGKDLGRSFFATVNTWLPKAERWLESERNQTIEGLLVLYAFGPPGEPRGWDVLPEPYRKHFGRPYAVNRLSAQQGLVLAKRGDSSGWCELFAAFGSGTDGMVNSGPALDGLDAECRWIVRLFLMAQRDLLGVVVGGQRMTLEPRLRPIQIQVGDKTIDGEVLGLKVNEQAPWMVQESAQHYGYYSHITDLRIATVAAIRFLLEQPSVKQQKDTLRKAAEKTLRQPKGKKRSSSGQAEPDRTALLKNYLLAYHEYPSKPLNTEPLAVRTIETADIGVSAATASRFFRKYFNGHAAYKRLCNGKDEGQRLFARLEKLAGDEVPGRMRTNSKVVAEQEPDEMDLN